MKRASQLISPLLGRAPLAYLMATPQMCGATKLEPLKL